LLVCASLVVAPLSQVHAHVSGDDHDDHISVHAGHIHVLPDAHHGARDHALSFDDYADDHAGDTHDHSADHDSGSHPIDLSADAVKPSFGVKSLVWIAVLCVMLLAIPALAASTAIRPPPRTRTLPNSSYPHALPLLRGPPHSI
jgi:hypothetical protein